ncbi:uncharacterized protein LMH87_007674 [Akanthomyces muscarius]|uniref:Cytochrome P450 n=1 Tax=Akanthomyces muscarius TaxID=2231603 RepID=A0A9W8QM41_AKAMU|nr:uncharacterized protein LMH87_007674 [Akanthomyces muscarius]KAJ4161647.1 hypothetical protein LMH87_007674 [Akanthomyces muscarius]
MTNPIINSSPDWELSIWTSIAFFAAYAVYLSVYRLWYSPIAHLPGPKLAALTQYYEFYHDTIRGSQYILSIEEMHKKYGPVVRINPWEVHVSDSDFHSELYTGSACHRHKWLLWEKHLGAPHSGLMSLGHDHHQMRRAPMDQFLSSKSVWDLQVIIENKANALLDRLRHEAKNPPAQPINVMYPLSAYTIDVINEIAFARNDHLIERSDFGAATTDSLLKATQVGSIAVHKNGAMASFNALPEAVLGRWVPGKSSASV